MTRNPYHRDLLRKRAWGGALYKTRAGRVGRRPIALQHSMHLVLRSSQARGELAFWHKRHKHRVQRVVERFARKHGIHLYKMANVGNHLHLHVQVGHRQGYVRFIRAVTSAIVGIVTQGLGTQALPSVGARGTKDRRRKFWDQRPFSRVVFGRRAFYRVRDYVDMNELQGMGLDRASASYWIAREYDRGERTDSA